jgi:antitoxin component YwqK of YwqJK toxin-antitoxin module
MRKITFLILILLFSGCKINQIKQNQRHGVWKESFSLDTINNNQNYASKEIYKLGKPIRTWKYYKNGALIRKEKYKKEFCLVKHFYENGKLEKRGKTKFDVTEKESHWYYTDDWEFFDTNGRLQKIITYKLGQAVAVDSVFAN